MILTALVCCAAPAVQGQGAAYAPVLNGEAAGQRATAGYYSLFWELPSLPTSPADSVEVAVGDHQFELQESPEETFSTPSVVYLGPDLATFLSGKSDGDYFYRVRSVGPEGPGPWSSVHRVEVRHHGLTRAFLFLSVGAIVFLATIFVIVRGDRKTRSSG